MELAKAHVVGNPRASGPMMQFARVRLNDAESGVHRIFKQCGLVPRVKIDHANLGAGVLASFPYIKLSSWVRWMLDTDRLHRFMVGVSSFEKMQVVLTEYWKRFRETHPNHAIFTMHDLPLDRTIPFFSHSDEGRSYKHCGIWVLSSHGCLGRGTRSYIEAGEHLRDLASNEMGLNFVGATWSTEFIFTTMLKTVYSKNPSVQDEMVKIYSQDVAKLLHDGVVSSDERRKVHLMHVATKGDLPALCRLGGFTRSYSHVPRAAASRRSCPGICHLCMAGVEVGPDYHRSVPFEDMRVQADWISTLHSVVPWVDTPNIINGVPLTTEDAQAFFVTDLWHNFHLGVAKHFVGSGLVSVIESNLAAVQGGSVEARFQWMTNLYIGYFRNKRMNPFIVDISRESMGFPQGSTCPIARWSKGAAASQFMSFLDWFCKTYIINKTDDQLLLSIVSFVWASVSFYLFML